MKDKRGFIAGYTSTGRAARAAAICRSRSSGERCSRLTVGELGLAGGGEGGGGEAEACTSSAVGAGPSDFAAASSRIRSSDWQTGQTQWTSCAADALAADFRDSVSWATSMRAGMSDLPSLAWTADVRTGGLAAVDA